MSDMAALFHLSGGARAMHGGDLSVELRPHLLGSTIKFSVKSTGQIVPTLTTWGLGVLGVESLAHNWEAEGIIPPDWRPFHRQRGSSWICFEAGQTWSQVRHAASKREEGKLWDIAARLAYQIEACVSRFRNVSNRYAVQVWSLTVRDAFRDGSRTDDIWTQSVLLEIQAFLTDVCVLRDYLAEFAAEYVYGLREVKVRTLSGLIKKVLNDRSREDALSVKLRTATGRAGWLAVLGEYRDLVVHSAPLAMAKKRLWVRCVAHVLPNGDRLPTVRFPLPIDPADIRAARGRGDLYQDFAKLSEDLLGAADEDMLGRDALEYLHETLGELATLALEFAAYSPIPPEMPVFTDADIVGPIQWDRPAG